MIAHRTILIAPMFLLLAAIARPAFAADKINVLIIDGQNNHGWQSTTPVIKDMLLKTERFSVEVLTSPPKPQTPAPLPKDATEEQKRAFEEKRKAIEEQKKTIEEAWAKFRPDFTKYQVVVSNYNGQNWPDDVNKAFEKYMKEGGGLVVYHAANNAFTSWAEWAKMVGLLWGGPTYGDRITVDDAGKVVRTPKGEGIGAGHGPQWAYEVVVRDVNHPVTLGLPEKWTHAKDELYQGQRGPAQDMHILVTAFASKDQKGSGANEPMVWTIPYGKGRVFVNLLGHDATSLAHPGCTALTCRGTEWAATGAVTIPAPKDIGKSAAPAPK